MERMASLPFDGSRRGMNFEGSMLLESCCTGASLAAGDGLRQPAGSEESRLGELKIDCLELAASYALVEVQGM